MAEEGASLRIHSLSAYNEKGPGKPWNPWKVSLPKAGASSCGHREGCRESVPVRVATGAGQEPRR